MQEDWIKNIDWIITYAKNPQYDEFVEVYNIDSLMINQKEKRVELYQDENHIGVLRYDDFIDWTEHIQGKNHWWEIDTAGFGIEISIKEED